MGKENTKPFCCPFLINRELTNSGALGFAFCPAHHPKEAIWQCPLQYIKKKEETGGCSLFKIAKRMPH